MHSREGKKISRKAKETSARMGQYQGPGSAFSAAVTPIHAMIGVTSTRVFLQTDP
jgi:hypothetical protein